MTVPLKIQDKVIGVISFASTGEKHFTKRDLSLAEELAKRAALAIENARLFQQSQAAIRARDDFMKMVSHELKTPVTSLKAYVQVMEREFQKKGDTTAFMRVKKMDTQLSSMTRLITELLDLSRIQTGKLVYHKKLFSMDVLVRGIVEEMQLTTNHHRILIKGQTNKSVYADRDRIGQVLINLISNAIKFSKEQGSVVVSVKDNVHDITVSVQDFGIGIPKEHQKRVFEQFYQVSDDTRQTFPGLGIGLYLSSDIIKNHHGRISVESSEGHGSTFSFTLPLPKNRKE
jgi:signal transduction histidine kinase